MYAERKTFEREARHSMFAAVEPGTALTGAVYGVGETPDAARQDAVEEGGQYEDKEGAHFAIVHCTPGAAQHVLAQGGDPSADLTVTARGICLRSEEEDGWAL